MIVDYDPILDMDSGHHMGFLLYPEKGSDITPDEVDAFMGDVEMIEAFPEGGDFNVTPCWVRKVPALDEYGGHIMRYVYSGTPGPGARRCVRVEEHTFWGHWCMNHIYEPASTGIPVESVADPIWPMIVVRIASPEERAERKHWRGPLDGEAYVYLCRDCAHRFHEREQAARAERLAAWRAERESA